jgi:hypothetical protein
MPLAQVQIGYSPNFFFFKECNLIEFSMTKITQFNISLTLNLNIFKSPSLNLIHKAFQQYQECAHSLEIKKN